MNLLDELYISLKYFSYIKVCMVNNKIFSMSKVKKLNAFRKDNQYQ